MSYILDALKKSENERNQGEIPDIKANHSGSTSSLQTKTYLPWIISSTVIIGIAVFSYIFVPKLVAYIKQDNTLVESSSDSRKSPTTKSPKKRSNIKARKSPIVSIRDDVPPDFTEKRVLAKRQKKSSNLVKVQNKSSAKTNTVKSNVKVEKVENLRLSIHEGEFEFFPMVEQLDLDIQQTIPAVNFTLHIFSTKATQSFVVVNTFQHVEGDKLGSGLVLERILSDGVVMNINGETFKMGMMKNWSYDK